MAQNPDLLNNEDFEKVDHEPYQDENVTSTSLTGEMAEEDLYEGNSGDLLGDEYTSTAGQPAYQEEQEQLISFESSPPPVPSAPPAPIPETTVTEPTPPPVPSPRVEPFPEPAVATGGAWLENVDPRVVDLIYWRDVKRTGIVFGSMMFVLMALACFSLISVLAYMSLAVLTVTFTFRVYKSIMQAVQKTNEGHPFKKLMEMNIELKDEVVQEAAENIAKHINNCHRELRRLYLVEDYVDSIKFGMLLWLLTYVGSWFSGMTLIMLVVVTIFTLPRVYETYKVQIDTYINMARAQLNKILAQISAKMPFPKKKAKVQ